MHSCGIGPARPAPCWPSTSTCRPAYRRRVVQGQPQPQAARDRRGRRGPGRLRPAIARNGSARPRRTFFVSSAGRPVTAATAGEVFNRIWDQAGLPRPAGGRAAPALRFPAPLRLRQHRAVDGPGQGRRRDAALPVALHGSRDLRSHLLLHSHLARLHGRLRAHHPGEPGRCCPRSGSNEARPGNRRPELLQLRQGLPARLHAHGPRTLAQDDRGLPDQPGMLPGLPRRQPGTSNASKVSFDHFDRQHLKAWLAWMADDRRYAPTNRHAAAQRRQGVPGLRCPRGHHPHRAQPGSQSTQGPGPAPASPSNTSPRPRPGPSWPRSPARRRSPAGTGCCSSCSTTPRRACRRDHRD